MSNKLGELLVKNETITPEQLSSALKEQEKSGRMMGSILVGMGALKDSDLLQFLSEQHGVPSIKLSEFQIDPEVLKIIPAGVASKYQVMPVSAKDSTLTVAMIDPGNIFALDDIKFLTGYRVEALIAAENSVHEAIEEYYRVEDAADADYLDDLLAGLETEGVEYLESNESVDLSSLEHESEEAPVIKLVNGILTDAITRGSSDIHIEPYERSFRVRFRIDGSLYEVMKPPLKMKNAITSRIKIMANLDIAERRLPQDGRIKLKFGKGRDMDYRVSVLPTLFGEKIVLRLLDKSSLQLDMTKLGFGEKQLNDFKEAINKPFGMVLVTGPTGSGKTTTLYSAITDLNQTTENISTAEDPVEYNLEGINQVQMHEGIGLTFASALRSFLRQDPDVILVGEIRDFETAEIAIKAALTGHMVLSTLHTNDAPSTVNRLLNMGIEPFLVSSSINLILAQRLARKICNQCKEPVEISENMLKKLGVTPEQYEGVTFYEGKGCDDCNNSGNKGRVALYEVMPMYEPIKELVLQGASSLEIKNEAISLGMQSLRQSGIEKMLAGEINYEEVLKTTVKDED
jgi:type IV pilus assembly protein PilB